MSITAVLGILGPIVGKVASKFLKNKGDKAKFLSELNLKLADQETKLIDALVKSDVAQAEINKADAQSRKFFQAGWRPSISWICVFGLAYSVFMPLISWGLKLTGVEVPDIPAIPSEVLTSLTFGILGLGAYRTYEKKQGVTK